MMSKSRPENAGAGGGTPEDDDPQGEKTLWEELGIPRPEYQDESTAPPVNRELLLAYERGELTQEQRRKLYRLLDTYKSWADAHAEILVEKMRSPEWLKAFDEAVAESDKERGKKLNEASGSQDEMDKD